MLRKLEERFFIGLMLLATGLVLVSLITILGTVLIKGLPALNLDMILKTPGGGYYLGKSGGIANAILGSLMLTLSASGLSILISLPVALYINIYAHGHAWLQNSIRLSLDILWGVPSIVYGAFGFTLMLALNIRASLLGGTIAIALLILPIMTRAMDEAIQMVPFELSEAASCLGATRLEIAFKVITRQALPGLISACLISFGRGIGDAAAVIFTAGFSDAIPSSLFDPAATLPLAIFFQLGTPFPEVQSRAYAATLILTLIILGVSLLTRLFAWRYSRHVIK